MLKILAEFLNLKKNLIQNCFFIKKKMQKKMQKKNKKKCKEWKMVVKN